jgi:hypothetical protein
MCSCAEPVDRDVHDEPVEVRTSARTGAHAPHDARGVAACNGCVARRATKAATPSGSRFLSHMSGGRSASRNDTPATGFDASGVVDCDARDEPVARDSRDEPVEVRASARTGAHAPHDAGGVAACSRCVARRATTGWRRPPSDPEGVAVIWAATPSGSIFVSRISGGRSASQNDTPATRFDASGVVRRRRRTA